MKYVTVAGSQAASGRSQPPRGIGAWRWWTWAARLLMFVVSADLAAQTSWTGAVSTNWFEAGNWTAGVPTKEVDVVVGDGNFTGPFQPAIVGAFAYCRSLTVGGGNSAASLTVRYTLWAYGDVTIGARGTVVHNTSRAIKLTGNWVNGGTYTTLNASAAVTMAGTDQRILGSTTFRRLIVAKGSRVELGANVAVNTQLTLNGRLDPGPAPGHRLSGTGRILVNAAGVLVVRAPSLPENYSPGDTFTLLGGSTVDYAADTDQVIASHLTYGKLQISGLGTKRLTNDLPLLAAGGTGQGKVTVVSGTLDLGPYRMNRATGVTGGAFIVRNGARVRLTGADHFPTGYKTYTLEASSQVEFAGGDQSVPARTYGNLVLTAPAGTATKTLPSGALIVRGVFVATAPAGGSLSFAAAGPMTFTKGVSLGRGTVFDGGSSLLVLAGNWTNHGTFLGNQGTVSINLDNVVLSGDGTNRFHHLVMTRAGITADPDMRLEADGDFGTSGYGTFRQLPGGSGEVVLSGSGTVLGGTGLTFERLSIPGTVTTASSFTVAGDLRVDGSLVATDGTVTLAGEDRVVGGGGTVVFHRLNVPGTITTGQDVTLRSAFSVTGAYTATGGTTTFGGTTSFTGTATLADTILNGDLLRLEANSVLRLTGVARLIAGEFDATNRPPNTVVYGGPPEQVVFPIAHHHIEIAGSGVKRVVGDFDVRGDLTILPGATLDCGAEPRTIAVWQHWINRGTFEAGAGTVEWVGEFDGRVEGSTRFNIARINKASDGVIVRLGADQEVGRLEMVAGTVATGTNALVLTGDRIGSGRVSGTLVRRHVFEAGTAYAFESPFTTVTFATEPAVDEVSVTSLTEPAEGFPFGAAINRHFVWRTSPTVPVEATVRLHYLDGELGGQDEPNLQLWRRAPVWTPVGADARDGDQDWIEKAGVTDLDGEWTLSESRNVVAWIGQANTDWNDPENWMAIDGAPSRPPGPVDTVLLGTESCLHQPRIGSAVTVRGVTFGSVQPMTVTLEPGGSWSVLGNLAGQWSRDAAHRIDIGDQGLAVGGWLDTGEGAEGRSIGIGVGSGRLSVTNALILEVGARLAFDGAGVLYLHGDFRNRGGEFVAGGGTVRYLGRGAQEVAGDLVYHQLRLEKPAGTATLGRAVTVAGDVVLADRSILVIGAELSVAGDVRIGSQAILSGGSSTMRVGGDWVREGAFLSETSEVVFVGTGDQEVSACRFNDFDIDKPSGVLRLTGDVHVDLDLDLDRGTLDLGAFSADREATGARLRLAAGTRLRTAGHFPARYAVREIHPESVVEYYGEGAQEVAAETYGHLVLEGGSGNPKSLVDATVVRGDLAIGPEATLVAGATSIRLEGGWNQSGGFVAGEGVVVLAGNGAEIHGDPAFNDLTISGSYAVAGFDLSIGGDLTVSGTFDTGSGTVVLDGDLTLSGVLTNSGTLRLSGVRQQTVQASSAIVSKPSSGWVFDGTVAPILDLGPSPRLANVTLANLAGLEADVGWTVEGTFVIASGSGFEGGEFTHVFRGDVRNAGGFASSGMLVFESEASQFLDLGGGFESSGTVGFGGTGPITMGAGPLSLGTVVVSNTHPAGVTAMGDWSVAGALEIASGSRFHGGTGFRHEVEGDLENGGEFDAGTSLFVLRGAASVGGAGSTRFHHLEIDGGAEISAVDEITVGGSLTNRGAFLAGTTRVTFSGAEPAVLAAASSPSSFGILTIAKPASALRLTGGCEVLTSLAVTDGTFDLDRGVITNAGGATLAVSAGAAVRLGGTNTLPPFRSAVLDPASLVDYAGDGPQTIAARTYGHLRSSSTGPRTLPGSGTVGIAGTFDPGSNTFTTAGSTVDYVGVGEQTIVAFPYGHLRSSAGGSRVLSPDGVIRVAGTFEPGSHVYTRAGSTVRFDGASQTIPAFAFHHLQLAGTGTKSLSGAVTVEGDLVATADWADGGFVATVMGHVRQTSNHSGTGRLRLAGGSAAHVVEGSGGFRNVELDDLRGLSVTQHDLRIGGRLTLTAGPVRAGTNRVVIERGGEVVRVAGHVTGALRRHVPLGASARTFEIGDDTTYAPVTLAFDGVTTAGDLAVSTTAGDPPGMTGSGLDERRGLNRYWSFGNASLVVQSCTARFEFETAELDTGADATGFLAARGSGTWTQFEVAAEGPNRLFASSFVPSGIVVFGEPVNQDGIWANASGGSWGSGANWEDGTIAQGMDGSADFARRTLSAEATVTLDRSRTLGHLVFGDRGGGYDWRLTGPGRVLTLAVSAGVPTLVVSNRTAKVGVVLGGTQGLAASGEGWGVLCADNTYAGVTTVRAGGRLGLAHPRGLGSTEDETVIESGATLVIATNAMTVAEPLVLEGDGVGGRGAVDTGSAMETRWTGAVVIRTAGARLVVGSAGAALSLEGGVTLAGDLTVGGSVVNTGVIEFRGGISGPGRLGNSGDAGTGTEMRLYVANDFGGDTVIRKSTLTLLHREALQFSTLDWGSEASIGANPTLKVDALSEAVLGGLRGDRPLSLPAGFTLVVGNNDVSTTFSGVLGGDEARLVKTGSGSLTLTGSNRHGGGTLVRSGPVRSGLGTPGSAALVVGHPAALGTGEVTLDPTVEDLRALEFDLSEGETVGNPIVLPGSGIGRVGWQGRDGASDFVLAGPIRGGHAGLVLSLDFGGESGGRFGLTNPSNDFRGTLRLRGGTLAIADGRALGDPANLLCLDPSAGDLDRIEFSAAGVVVDQGIDLAGDALLDLGGFDATLAGVIGGTSTVAVCRIAGGQVRGGDSTGSLRLTGGNTTAAGFRIDQDHVEVIVGTNVALGDAARGLEMAEGVDKSTLTLENVGDYRLPEPLVLRGGGVLRGGSRLGALRNAAGNNRFPGPIELAADVTIGVEAGTMTLTGEVTGPGALVKSGSGRLVLEGPHRYEGGTRVAEGSMQLGTAETSGSVEGPITIDGRLAVGHSGTLELANALHGSGAFESLGPGTLVLSGTNDFDGTTTVSGGVLVLNRVDGDGPVVSGDVLAVRGGASLVWSNDHQVADTVTVVLDGGTLVANGRSEALGGLRVEGDSMLVLQPGSPSTLEFAAADANAWHPHTLRVTNWSSADVLRFGTDGSGLGTGGREIAHLVFVNYEGSGLTTNAYIRSDGVVVPSSTIHTATRLVVQTQPSATTEAGAVLSVQPVVALVDDDGFVDTEDEDSVVYAVVDPAGDGGGLRGTVAVPVVRGVARFEDLTLVRTGRVRLRFGTDLLDTVESEWVEVTAGPADHLAWSRQPTSEVAGVVFRSPVRVVTRDAHDNLTTNVPAGLAVTVSLSVGEGTLSGTLTRELVADPETGSGSVTFDDLVLDVAGSGRRLTALATGLGPGVSEPFVVAPGNSAPVITGGTAVLFEPLKSFGSVPVEGMYPADRVIQGTDGRLYGTTASGGADVVGVVFGVGSDGSGFTVLHSFDGSDGQNPVAGLVEVASGRLVGTTYAGGTNGSGTVFALEKDGTGFEVLHHFGSGSDGRNPAAALVAGADGRLYGTTKLGGSEGKGTVFVLSADGGGYAVLKEFDGIGGAGPRTPLVAGDDGRLYGTTEVGGGFGVGTVFGLGTDGSGFALLHSFAGDVGGENPRGGLVQGVDGRLFGTTFGGGASGRGTVFAVGRDGAGFEVLHSFTVVDGADPFGGLVAAEEGTLFGTTYAGGSADRGTVFVLRTDGSGFAVLHAFEGGDDGTHPAAGMIRDAGGDLIGTTYYGGGHDAGTLYRLGADGSGYTVLKRFDLERDGETEGWSIDGGLVVGTDGTIFGTTYSGGSEGAGTVYRIDANGANYRVLHHFTPSSRDGGTPYAELILGFDGRLYGTTAYGGGRDGGTVFRLEANGSDYRVLHRFGLEAADGRRPYSGLRQHADGRLYGTTDSGGLHGAGIVFRLQPDGSEYTVLHSFGRDLGEGANPSGTPFFGPDGRLYGTAFFGGPRNLGTVYAMQADGSDFVVLHRFEGGADGAYPNTTFVLGTDGRLHSTTSAGGRDNAGTVFAIGPDGSDYGVIHEFRLGVDGNGPYAPLLVGVDGTLYGTTYGGGAADRGTVFRLRPDGTDFRQLYEFTGAADDGSQVYVGLARDGEGWFYGGTEGGGGFAQGLLYRWREWTEAIIDESSTWSWMPSAADGDEPAQRLTYALSGAPEGMTIDASTGRVQWRPTESQAPGVYSFEVEVTDDGLPPARSGFPLTVTVRRVSHPTTTIVAAGAPTSVRGQVAAFEVRIARVRGTGAPTGTVMLWKGETVLGTEELVDGGATFEVDSLGVGPHVLVVEYSGDGRFRGSRATLEHEVEPAEQVPLRLSSSGTQTNGTVQELVLEGGSGEGAVRYAVTSGPGTIVDGTRLLVIAGTGTVVLSVTKEADADYREATATAVVQAMPAGTRLELGSTVNPSIFGNPTVLEGRLTADSGVPGGRVSFRAGEIDLGAVEIDATGRAGLEVRDLPPGTTTVEARFDGNADFLGSTGSVVQVVLARPTTLELRSEPSPSVVGESVVFEATVSNADGTPTGTVVFTDGETPLGTATLDDLGRARWEVPAGLSVGEHRIVAEYGGTTHFLPSSDTLVHDVGRGVGELVPVASANPARAGVPWTLTATVRATGGAGPSGTVTIREGPTFVGSGTLDADGVAMIPIAGPSLGYHEYVAEYGGDAEVLPVSAILPLSVFEVMPSEGPWAGGNRVVITNAVPLGDGRDIEFVSAGGEPAFIEDQGSDWVRILMPPAVTTGTADILIDSAGVGSTLLDQAYSYHPPGVLEASGVVPAEAPWTGGRTILVSGLGLGSGSDIVEVTLCGVPVLEIRRQTADEVEVIAGEAEGPVTGDVRVVSVSRGETVAASAFAYLRAEPAPLVFAPASPQVIGSTNRLVVEGGWDGGSVRYEVLDGPGRIVEPDGLVITAGVGRVTLRALEEADDRYFAAEAFAEVQAAPASTRLELASSANPSTVADSVTLTASVVVEAPGSGSPTGLVRFALGAGVLGEVMLDGEGRASFATADLPAGNHELRAVYLGSVDFGMSTGSLTQVVRRQPQAPVAVPDRLGTVKNRPVAVPAAKLSANDTDEDGDSLTVVGVSATSEHLGTVTLEGGSVTYLPPLDFAGTDTFSYVVDDGTGRQAVGVVQVTITSPSAVSMNLVGGPIVEVGEFVFRFAGIPGRTYTIEFTENLSEPVVWRKAGNRTAPVTAGNWGKGVFEFRESVVGGASRTYRAVYPAY